MLSTADPARAPRHHDRCFGCGPSNLEGLRLELTNDTDTSITGRFVLRPTLQGPPKYGHGGILAAVLDESMSLLVHTRGITARTAQLEVAYHLPARINQSLRVRATLKAVDGRRMQLESTVTEADSDTVLASARATFVAIGGEAP